MTSLAPRPGWHCHRWASLVWRRSSAPRRSLASDHVDQRGLTVAILALAIGVAFIGTGLYAWWRRPHNRIGALMTWIAFAWLLSAARGGELARRFTVAVLGRPLYLAVSRAPAARLSRAGGWSAAAHVALVWFALRARHRSARCRP